MSRSFSAQVSMIWGIKKPHFPPPSANSTVGMQPNPPGERLARSRVQSVK
jgi:hypothetical protein